MAIDSRHDRSRIGGRSPFLAGAVAGDGWRIAELVCDAGPEDRPYEERHESVSIALVAAGSFTYRTDTGRALMAPGSILLGNAGRCYECGHEHGRGDRCIAFHLDRAYFDEIAARRAGRSGYAFATPVLPPTDRLLPATVAAMIAMTGDSDLAREELVVGVAEAVVGIATGHGAAPGTPAPRDVRRIGEALHRIETDAEAALDLASLAAEAGMSRYHFLRVFRRTVGTTPYQFVLTTRMRRAADRLATTHDPITAVAFDAGFGDLSTFVRRFRRLFGTSPSDFRRRHAAGDRRAVTP